MKRAPSTPRSILVVDDEESTLTSVRRLLRSHGFDEIVTCSDSREVLGKLESGRVRLVLLDLIMPHLGGEELLAEITRRYPDLPVIVVTAEYDARAAVRCMKLGADDYLLKPVVGEQLLASVERTLAQSALRQEATLLRESFFKEELSNPDAFRDIVSSDPGMFRIFAYLEAVAPASHPVLIRGETGTGKELVARALHRASGRSGPFVAVNVAGLDDAMFSDTLFGHESGAFTGASGARRGMIERADAGTLFLDEIGDLSETSQVKLLRLIQEREYYALGSDTPRELQARIVAAMQRDPSHLRPDLYYRLRSYCVEIPPLARRLGDLPLLLDHFLEAAANDLGRPKPTVPPELFVYLSNYDFPGNVRELQSMAFDAVARHEGGVMPLQAFLDQMDRPLPSPPRAAASDESGIRFPFPLPPLKAIEHSAVLEALRRVQGNRSAAARMLGISRPTVARHLKPRDEAEEP